MKKYLVAICALILVVPNFVFADIVLDIFEPVKTYIILPGLSLLFGVALLLFIWGGVKFIWNDANSEERNKGKKHMVWGIVGMAIMLSSYGITYFILNTVRSFGPGIYYDPATGERTEREVPTPGTLNSLNSSGF